MTLFGQTVALEEIFNFEGGWHREEGAWIKVYFRDGTTWSFNALPTDPPEAAREILVALIQLAQTLP